jgi:hypothetical protein
MYVEEKHMNEHCHYGVLCAVVYKQICVSPCACVRACVCVSHCPFCVY